MEEDLEVCQCRVPKCGECGLEVLKDGQKHAGQDAENDAMIRRLDYLANIVTKMLESVDLSETRRVVGHLCKIHYHLGDGTQNELREFDNKEGLIKHMCEKVGLEDVEPLMKLPQLLGLEGENLDKVTRYTEVLSNHQASVQWMERLPHGVECSSPPGTPLRCVYEGTTVFFGTEHGSDSKFSPTSSPAASPTGSNHSLQLAVPTEYIVSGDSTLL